MKVWPVVFVCLGTGALHISVSHNYGAEANLLCYQGYVAIRGRPLKVISDIGSQLVKAQQSVAYNKNEDPSTWDWAGVQEFAARRETQWSFIEPGCQWRNGVAENRVKVTKQVFSHVLGSTIMGSKPTLHYAQLVSLLHQVANKVNIQVLLDCSVLPDVICASQLHGQGVLDSLFYLTRTLCFAVHKARFKLLGKWNIQ